MEEQFNKRIKSQRSEEIHDIVERIPHQFSLWTTIIVSFIFVGLFFFSWIIKYPNIVIGQIKIQTYNSPIKLISKVPGKLSLLIKNSQGKIEKGEIIGYIDNNISLDTFLLIKNILQSFNPNSDTISNIFTSFPKNVRLGEITTNYFDFIKTVDKLISIKTSMSYEEQIEKLEDQILNQKYNIKLIEERINNGRNNMLISKKFYTRDSILFQSKVISEAELDQAHLKYLESQDNYQTINLTKMENNKVLDQLEASSLQLKAEKNDTKRSLRLQVISTYNNLVDKMNEWESNYVFKAPFSGVIQFLGFWAEGEFINKDEELFSIIPSDDKYYGQVLLSENQGAGKVKIGQSVIIKLKDFPYLEFGYVKGIVKSISLTTNIEQTTTGKIGYYMIYVKLNNGLETNYGKKLVFKNGISGTVEIITQKRRLFERLFDNIKYLNNN